MHRRFDPSMALTLDWKDYGVLLPGRPVQSGRRFAASRFTCGRGPRPTICWPSGVWAIAVVRKLMNGAWSVRCANVRAKCCRA